VIRVNNPFGRLVTIRLISPVTEEEYERFDMKVRHLVSLLPPNLVFCSDLRYAGFLPSTVAQRIPESMRRDQPWLRRAALLIQEESAVAALQFRRIIKEASNNPSRRAFTDAEQALSWLSEVLLLSEQKHLESFIRSRPSD
jgi:hypothetical protein